MFLSLSLSLSVCVCVCVDLAYAEGVIGSRRAALRSIKTVEFAVFQHQVSPRAHAHPCCVCVGGGGEGGGGGVKCLRVVCLKHLKSCVCVFRVGV